MSMTFLHFLLQRMTVASAQNHIPGSEKKGSNSCAENRDFVRVVPSA